MLAGHPIEQERKQEACSRGLWEEEGEEEGDQVRVVQHIPAERKGRSFVAFPSLSIALQLLKIQIQRSWVLISHTQKGKQKQQQHNGCHRALLESFVIRKIDHWNCTQIFLLVLFFFFFFFFFLLGEPKKDRATETPNNFAQSLSQSRFDFQTDPKSLRAGFNGCKIQNLERPRSARQQTWGEHSSDVSGRVHTVE